MAITYPLNTPTNLGIANITLSAENAVAISQSPFTFQQQIVAHPGQRWAASVSLPPMKRQDAEYWIAFLLSLKGQVGTFLLGDPNCVAPQGSVTALRNLLTFTEQFDNAIWVKSNTTVTANTVVAPNGTTTGDDLVVSILSSGQGISSAVFVADGTSAYAASIYVLKTTGTGVPLSLNFRASLGSGTTYSILSIDTTTGFVSFSLSGSTSGSYNVEDLGSWWRISTVAEGIPAGSIRAHVRLTSQPVGTTVSIWGAQLEVGSSTTAYQGVVASYGPSVNGGSQTGDTLVIDGCSPNVNGFLLPGDYIQIGSASAAHLYKVLTSVDTDNSGGATVDIWPNLRSSPADDTAVITDNTKGRFRLRENVQQWQINEISSYGITFDCVEAI